MAQKIYILRHGETEFNLEKRVQGSFDSPLTSAGVEQARSLGQALKKYLAGHKFSIYSSSLGRAIQTSHLICEEIECPKSQITEEPRLRELSLGSWEKSFFASLVKDNPNLFSEKDWYFKAPNGESYEAIRTRLLSWLADLPDTGDIVVVTHALTSMVLRGILLDLDYEKVWKLVAPQNAFYIVESGTIKRIKIR